MTATNYNHNPNSMSTDSVDLKGAINQEPGHKPEMIVKNFAREYETAPGGTYQNLVESCGNVFGWFGMFCCLCESPFKKVQQGEVGLVQKFGALSRTVEPGLCRINTWSETLIRVSVKVNVKEMPALTCFSKDNVSIGITSVVYYNIVDPFKAIFNINDIDMAIGERTQTTLRDVTGNRTLQDVVEKREEIAADIKAIISKTAYDWGVNIDSILIKDLVLPPKVQESLSKATEAKRIGESKIINARAEVESAKLMRKAADILASKAAMQIRYLDAMQSMAKNAGSRVIFMPSAQEIEKMSQSGFTNNTEKARPVDLSEESDWASPHNEVASPQATGNRQVLDTVAINEALYPRD
ncbi:hypothetical protein DICA3_E22584 [Diutina catenulata]